MPLIPGPPVSGQACGANSLPGQCVTHYPSSQPTGAQNSVVTAVERDNYRLPKLDKLRESIMAPNPQHMPMVNRATIATDRYAQAPVDGGCEGCVW